MPIRIAGLSGSRAVAAVFALGLSGCAAVDAGGPPPLSTGDRAAAAALGFQPPASPPPASPVLRLIAATEGAASPVQTAPDPSALYASAVVTPGPGALSLSAASALASRAPGGTGAPALLASLAATAGGVALPEIPLALVVPTAEGAAATPLVPAAALPPTRADTPVTLSVTLRAATTPAATARAAAIDAAGESGLTAGPRAWLLASLSGPAVSARRARAAAALDRAYGPPVALGAPTQLTLAPAALAVGEWTIATLEPRQARSRREPDAEPGAPVLDPAAPALGFAVTPGAAPILVAARYADLGLVEGPGATLADALRREGGAADRAFSALSDQATTPPPALVAEQCRVLRDFFRAEAGLTPVDRIAATVETLRQGGREAVLFQSDACLAAGERRLACATGILNCGVAGPALDEAAAIKALVDYMRRPTQSRRRALAALLPHRLTIVDAHLAVGEPAPTTGGRRTRFERDAALDLLSRAKLNRYGGAAANPDDPDWWVTNFTRRPALGQIVTLYAAFDGGRFDDIGFIRVGASAADLADPSTWAGLHLAPLARRCDRASDGRIGPAARRSRALADCAGLDDFSGDPLASAPETLAATAAASPD